MSDTAVREFTIQNETGLHARPAAMFVKMAAQFVCEVWVEKEEEQVNGKSIMGLMMLAAGPGSVIKITTEGEGCEAAMEEIAALIDGGFQGL